MDEIEEERRRREEVEDEKELLGQVHTPVAKQLPQEKVRWGNDVFASGVSLALCTLYSLT